jgi:hypothetical protein
MIIFMFEVFSLKYIKNVKRNLNYKQRI